ncbi:hypothetical protein BOTBODRAFT_649417 [Botryobasidium botryosum FD-172 SS1]|uniref:Protein kinase domain-containing protein n=1 Tax=Botryobasidium botryosum (strain FD-172 SS1) TaxID=930990 RepID=A0A067LW51_BOTB1|nr:hypothetical protein BOTBODRAFT_649417 [Botryobasidium botryosum FD-172 SS1]
MTAWLSLFKRLAREAKVWSQLSHPNVLPFLGLCTLESVPYLVSPWMENGHALDFVQKKPDADRLRLLAQVADGLEYLHNFKPKPVVHGDLRGPNILISLSGNACLADFGLSELKTDIYETNYSTPFITAGHPRWQAPEVIRAENKEEAWRNTSTDVFAFGRVMLELFTGKVPFSYLAHDATVIIKISNNEFPRRPDDEAVVASGLDDSMWQLMTDCWHATPSERPTATNLVARLTAALKSRSPRESSSGEKESSIGSSESPVTLDAMADADTELEGLSTHRPDRPGKAESPPSKRKSLPSEEEPSPGEEESASSEGGPSTRPKKRLRVSE